MKTVFSLNPAFPRVSQWVGMGVLALYVGCALAASAEQNAKARRYEADRQACLHPSPTSTQSVQNCLRQAAAARNDPVSSTPSVSPEQLEQNARMRCDALGSGDREDCLARMRGEGILRGSVDAGGIYRELETDVLVVIPPPQ